MLYRNISSSPQYIVKDSVKQLIQPGAEVILSNSDMRCAGSNIRNFESVYKAKEIEDFMFLRTIVKRTPEEIEAAIQNERGL